MEGTVKNELDVREIAEFLEEHKARDVVALDLRGISPIADFFVIATFQSEGHLRGLLGQLTAFCEEKALFPLSGTGRLSYSEWVLLDYGVLVIHLMSERLRGFYQLEKLWHEAPVIYGSSSKSS